MQMFGPEERMADARCSPNECLCMHGVIANNLHFYHSAFTLSRAYSVASPTRSFVSFPARPRHHAKGTGGHQTSLVQVEEPASSMAAKVACRYVTRNYQITALTLLTTYNLQALIFPATPFGSSRTQSMPAVCEGLCNTAIRDIMLMSRSHVRSSE